MWWQGAGGYQQEVAKAPLQFSDRYTITSRLGKGCFAKVYAARRIVGGSPLVEVAVKVTDLRSQSSLAAGLEAINTHRCHATQREAAMLRRASGLPNCVCYLGAHIEGCWSYLVMERCDRSLMAQLDALAGEGRLTEAEFKSVLGDMLEALRSIHAKGIVHRDVKPDNFLVSGPNATVKLCDFGLSDTVSESRPKLTSIYGTAPFMSPEMLANRGYDTQTDMWSFAVLVYVLLLGHFPYTPLDRTSKGMTSAILAGIPAPSFQPKRSIARSGIDLGDLVSQGAVAFMRSVLVRNPTQRWTAEQARESAFIAVRMEQEGAMREARSLAWAYAAAKQAGAFTINKSTDKLNCAEVQGAQVPHGYTCEDFWIHCDTQSTQASARTHASEVEAACRSPTWGNFEQLEYAYMPCSGLQNSPYCFTGQQYIWA